MRRAGIGVLVLAAIVGAGCDRDLVPSPRARAAARDDADARRLAAQLDALPGVTRAEVVVHRPFVDPLARPEPPAAPAAAVLVVVEGEATDELPARARRLARAALPDLPAAAVTLEVATRPAPTRLARVGPFEVAASSRAALRATLALGLAAIAALAGVLAYRERRRRAG